MTQAPVPWISKLHIENFKSIESEDLDLGPLTVLVGANSAGKSSVLQTLVLLSQIVRGRSQSSLVNLNGAELQLGTFADIKHSTVGKGSISFSVVLNVADNFRSSWRYLPGRPRRGKGSARETLCWRLVLGRPDSTQIGSAKVTMVELETGLPEGQGRARATFRPTRSRELVESAAARSERLEQYRVRGDFVFPAFYGFTRTVDRGKFYDARLSGKFRLRRGPFGEEIAGNARTGGKHFCVLDNGLPLRIFAIVPDTGALANIWLNGIEEPLRKAAGLARSDASQQTSSAERPRKSAAESADEIVAMLFPSFRKWVDAFDEGESPKPRVPEADLQRLGEVLGDTRRVEQRLFRGLAKRLQEERSPREMFTRVPTQFDELAMELREGMSTALWYLGPLREDPSPAYRPGQGGGIARLGLKGEYTVPELERFGQTEIEAILPPDVGEPLRVPVFSEQPEHEEPERSVVKTTLKNAVDKWMTYLGVASAVEVHPSGRAGIELGIVDYQTDAERNLTNVGVGVSQLLPVVVMCLRAQRGDVVLIEQPELHLHPAPQQALGDFLLATSVSGRQLIVETHSEYLINRLRLRIAEDDGESVSNLVKIIYAERQDGKTKFRPIRPNAYGSFDDWPDNFFDQAPKETELILRAAMTKRKRLRERAGDRHPTPTTE
jgi:predicted ATPase